MIPGQSLRKSRSNNRRFVTKSFTSDTGSGFNGCGCDLLFVLTDKLRDKPWLVFVVAVDDCEVDRDMLSLFAFSLEDDDSKVAQQLQSAVGSGIAICGVVYAPSRRHG